MRTLPTSVILHRIKQPLLAQTFWATAVSLVHAVFGRAWHMSVKVGNTHYFNRSLCVVASRVKTR